MLRTSDKRLWLPTPRQIKPPDVTGLGAPGLAAAMDGEIDWLRVIPPVSDFTSWYDAYDYKTMSGQGTLSAAIQVWLNKASASQNYLSQATGASRPVYGSRRLGQYYGLDFTSTPFMAGSSTTEVPARPMSAMVVYDLDDYASQTRFFFSSNSGNNRLGMRINTSGVLQANIFNVTDVTGGPTTTTGLHVAGMAISATNFKWFYDGAISNTSNSNSTSAGTLIFGTYGGAGNNQFDGGIGEFFLWNRELSTQELTDMYGYLKAKWGTP